MDKRIAQFLGLCQRAGKLSSGETGALSAIKDGSAELVIVAENASVNTKKRFSDSTRFYNKKMMDTLKNPQLDEETARAEVMEAERLTIRDILREYFYENNVLYAKEMVRESKKKNSRLGENEKRIFTAIEKNISDSWPDEAALSKMKSRKLDVTRKVLILLFLATEPGPDPDGEEEFTRDEVFQDLYQRLNDMLALCGFAALDPRVPFDWMILYCICVQDMFDVDARMRAMFREMFGERLWTAE